MKRGQYHCPNCGLKISDRVRTCPGCGWDGTSSSEIVGAARGGAAAALIVIGLPALCFGIAAVLWAPHQTNVLDEPSIRWLTWTGYGCLMLFSLTAVALAFVFFKTRKN